MPTPGRAEFVEIVRRARGEPHAAPIVCVPVVVTLLADHLTPVVAYRRLVAPDQRDAPSFLLESVEGGERQGRYSILGARPRTTFLAREGHVRVEPPDPALATPTAAPAPEPADPFALLRAFARARRLVRTPGAPACFLGGLVGYAAYDSVRYSEPDKLPFARAPRDDRTLPDVDFAYYDGVVIFDHVAKCVHVVELAEVAPTTDPAAAYDAALARLRERLALLDRHSEPLRAAELPPAAPPTPLAGGMSREAHAAMLARAFEYIRAGDIFQVVLGQRFERVSPADPFDVYRALRTVNPSPYMVYLQARGCILVASSPEILCRVEADPATGRSLVTNRPLAGTRRRGRTIAEDQALERDLLADPKERAEHIMLVDLGRNDVGRVAEPGTIALPRVMDIERYSHVMHISSTVTGVLRDGLDCWDALAAALPVGTISGAPKVRAMQIIDELEPIRRGPYGGGLGCVGLDGQMDIALTLRTIVAPLNARTHDGWTYHLQASGGIVADSDPAAEYQETVNKAAALARAIDVAEHATRHRA
jgi:anthranilate synthase component 1